MWERLKSLPIIYKAGSLFILLALVAALVAWYDKSPKGDPSKFNTAPPIAGTQNLPKEDKKTSLGTIKIIPKKKLKGRVPLPPEIEQDPSKEVTATGEAPPSETGTDIITVVDMNTGDMTISTKPKPASLMEFENKRRIGVGYGVGTSGTSMKVFGEWTFARVAGAHVGVQGEINATATKSPEAKAIAVIDYRW